MTRLQWAELQVAVNPMNTTIISVDVSKPGLAYPAIQVTKTVVIGNYLFVTGFSSYKMNVTVGSTYYIGIFVYGGSSYITSGTYEGDWTYSLKLIIYFSFRIISTRKESYRSSFYIIRITWKEGFMISKRRIYDFNRKLF
jgi:hypothetical protein